MEKEFQGDTPSKVTAVRGRPLAPIHLANAAGAATAAQSGEMQGEGSPLQYDELACQALVS